MDSLGHLKRLSLVKSGKNIRFLTPAANPGGHCPMWVSNTLAEKIENLSSLMIGMPECANHSRTFTSRPEGKNGEMHWLYTLDEKEVVFGCREGVMDALRQMDKAGAQAILMIATCVTDLIGEDFEGIISELQPELTARLAFETVGHFRNFSYQIGTWKTMDAIGTLMEKQPRSPRTVNAMLVEPFASEGEVIELPPIVKVLEDNGITVRRLVNGVGGAKLKDYREAPDAALNLVLCAYMQPLAEKMQREFGIPYISLHTAFGVDEVDRAYAEIASMFTVDLQTPFAQAREKAIAAERVAKERLNGLSYVFMRRVDMPVPLACYLAGFGMKPLLLHIEDLHPEDPEFGKKLKELGFDPPVCRSMNFDVDVLVVKGLEPDICFGTMDDQVEDLKWAEEMGDFFGMVGYERIASLLGRIFEVLETGRIGGKQYGIA